jgi:HK97 family phage prohead protease
MALKDINTTPTKGMREEARKGLEWRKKYGRGGTSTGVSRARDIINGDLSISTIKRMYSFFSRHENNKAEHYSAKENDGGPTAWRIAWALWGGNAGFSWSKKKVKEIEREEKSFDMKDNKEIRVFTANCEVRKDDESEDYRVSGYAALFDHESRDLGFRETISRNAFDGRLDDNVILTYNHDMNAILDRNQGGTLKLSVDERGLKYDGTLPNTSTGNDVAELMRRGLLYESSFAFTVEDDEWSR